MSRERELLREALPYVGAGYTVGEQAYELEKRILAYLAEPQGETFEIAYRCSAAKRAQAEGLPPRSERELLEHVAYLVETSEAVREHGDKYLRLIAREIRQRLDEPQGEPEYVWRVNYVPDPATGSEAYASETFSSESNARERVGKIIYFSGTAAIERAQIGPWEVVS